jgi:hypothetical protein
MPPGGNDETQSGLDAPERSSILSRSQAIPLSLVPWILLVTSVLDDETLRLRRGTPCDNRGMKPPLHRNTRSYAACRRLPTHPIVMTTLRGSAAAASTHSSK